MGSSTSFRDDDYALISQQQIRGFRESLDSEAKKSKARSEDRISKLPDEILYHILSFIPTKQVVKTSILSTRWRDIWVYVPNWTLNINDFSSNAVREAVSLSADSEELSLSDQFIAFVDRALLIRDSAPTPIQKFHLNFSDCRFEDFSAIDRWIGIAVKCKVVDLDISIEAIDGEDMYELPECLLTCKTLKIWKLWSNHSIKIPSVWCCPSLKSLHVTFHYPASYNPDNNVMDICNFPVLEDLKIDGYLGPVVLRCNISVPSLKTLRISLVNEYNPHEKYHFIIDAPKLEKLNVSETDLSDYTFRNAQSLVEVNVDVLSSSTIRASKFLAGLSGVKCLTLPSQFYAGCSVAEFKNLNKLTLVRVRGDRRWWKTLLKFLERSPSLECLVIEEQLYMIREITFGRGEEEELHTKKKRSANLKGFVIYHEKGKLVPRFSSRSSDVLYWRPPTLVPKCLLSSLKTITIHGFQFLGEEKELIKYLLKHGRRVLEKMAVHV